MNSPLNSLATRVIELIGLFNDQKMDLPERLIHPHCVFRLNGRAYHEQLGRPAEDPLVRLIGCGPAGYRFLLTALRYAVDVPHVSLEEPTIDVAVDGQDVRLSARGTLRGTVRGETAASEAPCGVTVRASADGWVHEIAVIMGDPDVERLLAARRR